MIAIIPARGGSKGLPGKNIKDLNGKPLIAYSIEAALKAKHIDEVIVSTDDHEIARISLQYGAKIPFLRPDYLATDSALALDNYIYTINRLNSEFNYNIKEFVILQPTSPLRIAEDIDNAIDIFKLKKADSVISVCLAEHPPIWAKKITKKGFLKNYFKTKLDQKNRQTLSPAYMPNGSIYVFNVNTLFKNKNYYFGKSFPYNMPSERSIDIDTQFDFDLASFILKIYG